MKLRRGDGVFENPRIGSAIDTDFEVLVLNECRRTIPFHGFMLNRPALYRSPVGLLSAYLDSPLIIEKKQIQNLI